MAGRRERRKKYLVNERLQMQFSWLLLIQLVIPTVTLGTFLFIINKMYLSSLQKFVGETVISEPYIQSILTLSVLAIVIVLIISGILLIF